MAELTIQQIQEAIRIAEAAGDASTAENLRKRLQQHTIND